MYGPTIRQIRLDKDLPLKSIYINVCSKTNAIKFEKGERQLAVDKFNDVLTNLMITMDEFLWIHNDYRPQKNYYYKYVVSTTWNSNNLLEFQQQIQNIEADNRGIERVQLASYRLLSEYRNNVPPSELELSIVINYFSNLASWTLNDVNFFINNCYVLPYTLMTSLLQEVWKTRQKYKYYRNSDSVFAIMLINCLDRMVAESDVDNALVVLEKLNHLNADVSIGDFKMLAKYYDAKIIYLYKNKIAGREKLMDVLHVAQFLENQQIVTEIKNILRK